MESKVKSSNHDDDSEEGLCSDSSDGSYTPLTRPPNMTKLVTTAANSGNKDSIQMDADDDVGSGGRDNNGSADNDNKFQNNCDIDSNSPNDTESSSDESSDNCLKKLAPFNKSKSRHRVKRTVMVRLEPNCDHEKQNKTRFKKYDIWTKALQEEALTETMRGCGVTKDKYSDRNVENYDLSLNCPNVLKRRRPNFVDDHFQNYYSKRPRRSSRDNFHGQRRLKYERLGKRDINVRTGSSTSSSSAESTVYESRHIEDISENNVHDAIALAQEMSIKLNEAKQDLLVRIVEVLGTELPLQIYKETQRIEAEGGMEIKNGKRRRSPGGVFLFLLKHNDMISDKDKKAIFIKDYQNFPKQDKQQMRERKVEELKECLTKRGFELPAFSTRKEPMLLGDDVDNAKPTVGNLSNPPPSPEVIERSPDYNSLAINRVSSDEDVNDLEDKPSTSRDVQFASCDNNDDISPYNDDFLDINCADIEFL